MEDGILSGKQELWKIQLSLILHLLQILIYLFYANPAQDLLFA